MNCSNFFCVLAISIVSSTLFGCASSEIGESKDVSQDKIYQEYNISYTQGNEQVEVFSQFRFAGEKGTTLVLSSPSKLELDGILVKVDSTKYSGAFYNVAQPVKGFYGEHLLEFTDINNKKFSNYFSFDLFKLVNTPLATSKSKPLVINYETAALKGDDYIKITSSNTDSSFSVIRTATDASGIIVIPAKELSRQKVKNLSLSASLYRKRGLQQATGEGGQLTISYTLSPITIELK